MLLSIIIPIFNVERYIDKCIQSVLNQRLLSIEYEVILVNDGTQDNSMQIAMKAIENHLPVCHVKVVEQSNEGLSAARNKGLSIASGDYVWFVDSDDYISHDSIEIISNYIAKYSPDCLLFDMISFNEYNDIQTIYRRSRIESRLCTGLDYFRSKSPVTPAQRFIIKRALLRTHNLLFATGIYHEDCEFVPRLLYYSKRFIYCKENIYYYLIRTKNSITSSFNIKRCLDLVKIAKSIEIFADSRKMTEEDRRFYKEYVLFLCNQSLDLIGDFKYKNYSHFLDSNGAYICKTNRLYGRFLNGNIKKRLWSVIASFSPLFYIKIKRLGI